ncbi:YncE family protein [Luteimonas gilva]|uniref:YncE family protein n=1 Tax=Luteimonas gilva TaxID=2572684 RepID=A0A4V5ZPU5_9GAMM|nr:YncE family protein [Luteimonas gilva]TKR30423.1 YncE family protein [Luteimonas gilva]
MRRIRSLSAVLLAAAPALAMAQVVGVALDPKAVLVDGELKVLPSPPADSAVFLRFDGAKAKEIGRVPAATSFQGPPSSVAISADAKLALVTAFMRIDPADPSKLAPEKKLTVVDLSASPIEAVQTLELGAQPSSVALNRAGTIALVPHTADDSVTVLAIADGRARVVEKMAMEKGSGPLGAAFSPDGRRALISFPNAGRVGVYAVENGRLKTPAIREMTAGIWPTALSYCGDSGLAVVANYGKVGGDADTVSLLDVAGEHPRVIDTVTVGPSPEGVACSPDGRYAAAALQNMSTVAKSSPFHSPRSKLAVLKIDNRRLHRLAEAAFGPWAQGVGFLDDSRTLFAQSMGDRSMHLFRIEGDALKAAAPPIVFVDGAPTAYGISGR